MIYLLDGLPLTEGEARNHAQFLRSPRRLPSAPPAQEDSFDRLARDAYDYADAMMREYRRRSGGLRGEAA